MAKSTAMNNIYKILIFSLLAYNLSGQCITKCSPDDITYTPSSTGVSYLWDDGSTGATLIDGTLGTQTHSVTVTDASGCTYEATQTGEIFETPDVECQVIASGGTVGTVTNPVGVCTFTYCSSDHTSFQLRATPFISGATYVWSGFATGTSWVANGTTAALGVGTHNASVIVDLGSGGVCTSVLDFEIIIEACSCDIVPTCAATDITCNGANDGEILVTENGVAPYTYAWSGGASGNPATGLAAGTYTVTVTDADGCTGEVSCDILEPTLLALACNGTDVTCGSAADGTATVTASGGTAGYTYSWSDGQTTATAIGLAAGTYSVDVTDANGCVETCSVTIVEPVALAVTGAITEPSCNGNTDGSILLSPTGGTPSYTVSWDNGSTSNPLIGVGAGTYVATVTDVNGCTVTETFTLTDPALFTGTLGCN